MDAEKLRLAREKLTRVFRYLEALNQHRNPAKRQIHEQLWSLRLRDLPEHSSIRRGTAKLSASTAKNGNSQNREEAGPTYILTVQRPRLTPAPEPPDEITEWLQDGWDDPTKAVILEETHERSASGTAPSLVKFDDDPARVESLERWKALRGEWVKTEKPARAAMKVFESL
jgi:hypothetical protein